LSLVDQQHGRFYFGSKLDELRYCPKGYRPIAPTSEQNVSRSISAETSFDLESADVKQSVIYSSELIEHVTYYFEAKLKIPESRNNNCIQLGLFANPNIFVFMAYNQESKKIGFFKAVRDPKDAIFFDELVPKSLVSDTKLQELIAIHSLEVHDGSIIGVGITNGYVFFTNNGKLFCILMFNLAVKIHISLKIGIPYFRNIPRFILNLGQSDYKTAQCNLVFSPTKIARLVE
jgi:hypothetical protein